MYRKQVRRRRAVLLLLVVASLTLLSLYFREGSDGPFHRAQRGVATVLGPFEEGADRALKPVRDLVNWFDETFEARGENDDLRDELAETRDQLAQAQTAARQGDELAKLQALTGGGLVPPGYEPVTARVIGRSPTVWYSVVTIDKGSGAGLRVDDPVVAADGLAGRVSAVTKGTAQVTLITDAESSVTGRVLPEGATGVVEPNVGDPRDLLLNFVQREDEISENQMVVTAGYASGSLDSLFPPGIPIGEVTDATAEETQAYQRVHLRAFADLRDMEFVQALVQTRGDGA
ncbi:MAG TPA: rod shape-determining protein MreC [Solirubrobacterales bacterium]|jgi:rod shape-determining protein MreC|nr:rod shape-determining protein MreC [Solirubrobacterales bacterium]